MGESTTQPIGSRARRASLLFKCTISLFLLAVLFWRTDRELVFQTIRSLRPFPFLGAVVLYWVAQFLSGVRWQLLLRVQEVRIPLGRLMLFYLEGMFAGLFMPATIGSDLVRAYRINNETDGRQGALASIPVERLSGLAALIVIAVVALLLSSDRTATWVVLAAACVFILGLVMVFNRRLWAWVSRILSRHGFGPLGAMVDAVADGIGRYGSHQKALGAAFVQSLLVQLVMVYAHFLAARALGFTVPFEVFLVLVPIVTIVTMIPVSISGLGVREGTVVYLFGQIGLPSASALSLSLTWFLTGVLASLPGGLVFAFLDHKGYRAASEGR